MYIPPEVEQQLKTLEGELLRQKSLNSDLNEKLKSSKSEKTVWASLSIILLITVGVGGYFLWSALNKTSAIIQITEEANPSDSTEYIPSWDIGVWYAVQVGAFEKRNLQLYDESLMQFHIFRDGEIFKYSLGVFASYEEAHAFRKEMIALGLKDSFVQAYKDGKAIGITEALK